MQNLSISGTPKRKRVDTGGHYMPEMTGLPTPQWQPGPSGHYGLYGYPAPQHQPLPYLHVANNIQVGSMTDSQKLNFIKEKMCTFEGIAKNLQNMTDKLTQAYNKIRKS